MSVINQMLKDLDARGGGDPQRRAALAAAGQGVKPTQRNTPSPPGAAVLVAVLATAALAALFAWWFEPGRAPTPATPASATAQPATAAPTSESALPTAAPALLETPPPAAVEPLAPPAVAPPAVAPPRAEAPAVAAPAPAPARSRIEVLPATDTDPLAAVREALSAGDAESALRQLESARSPPTAEADALAAAALQQLGRHEAAVDAYTRALRGEPDIGAWWAGLGISLEAASRGGEALSAYREAQRRGPLDAALADYVGGRVEALSATDDPGASSR